MQESKKTSEVPEQKLDEGLTELMKAHLDNVTGGLAAGHNSWRQTS